MSLRIKEEYESFKKYGNIVVDYYEILCFYPDYYKTKVELEKKQIMPIEQFESILHENYKQSEFYKELTSKGLPSIEIYATIRGNALERAIGLNKAYMAFIAHAINLCELIDYIGHYPSTYPVPKEEEKNPKMEELLEKYDIIVRYSIHDDMDTMYIMSDDVVRIIDTLKETLEFIKIMEDYQNDKEYLFINDKDFDDKINNLIARLDEFPLSIYQKEGKSRREEAKRYLRLNYGDVI